MVRNALIRRAPIIAVGLLAGICIAKPVAAQSQPSSMNDGVTEISALTSAFKSPSTCENVDPIARYGNELRFQIRRDDAPVGTHIVQFNRGADGIQVVAQSKIDISFLGFNAYSFRYRSESLWQNGVLAALSVKVDDDGDLTNITAKRENNELVVTGPDGEKTLPPGIYPTDHWNCGVLSSTMVLNTLTGNPNDVTIRPRGQEKLPSAKGPLSATHFTYDGDLVTNAWYDRDGRWVGLQFKARDGSTIVYRCMNCAPLSEQKDQG